MFLACCDGIESAFRSNQALLKWAFNSIVKEEAQPVMSSMFLQIGLHTGKTSAYGLGVTKLAEVSSHFSHQTQASLTLC